MDNVRNNEERKANYAREYVRYNKAIKYNFYLEAIAIIYAIIEDRLVSVLHHLGIVSRKNDNLRINGAVYPYIRKLMKKDETATVYVKNVSVKIEIIKQLLALDEDRAIRIDNEVEDFVRSRHKRGIVKKGYMHDLYMQMNRGVSGEKLDSLFHDFKEWVDVRNKLIHALLNKTVASTEDAKMDCAESGYKLSRRFDDQLVAPIKKNNSLRKKYKIQ